jgi:hypothetical protein
MNEAACYANSTAGTPYRQVRTSRRRARGCQETVVIDMTGAWARVHALLLANLYHPLSKVLAVQSTSITERLTGCCVIGFAPHFTGT